MNTTLWLRVAAVIALFFAAGHALGGRKHWSPIGETEVLRSMRTFRFDFAGVSRSYLDFFVGFGHCLSVTLVLQAVLLWQLATLARTDAASVRPLVAAFALASLTTGIVAWRFIFPVPAVFSAVLAVVLAAAWFSAR